MLGSPPGRCPDGGHGGVGMAWARQQPEQHLAIRPPRLRGPCLSVAPDRARACWPPRYPQGCVVSGADADHVLSTHRSRGPGGQCGIPWGQWKSERCALRAPAGGPPAG